jgi:hypothetical protein
MKPIVPSRVAGLAGKSLGRLTLLGFLGSLMSIAVLLLKISKQNDCQYAAFHEEPASGRA